MVVLGKDADRAYQVAHIGEMPLRCRATPADAGFRYQSLRILRHVQQVGHPTRRRNDLPDLGTYRRSEGLNLDDYRESIAAGFVQRKK